MQHVHLWIYNHPIIGIIDQIEFFTSLLKQKGYRVTMGNQPNTSALNVVIENFEATTSKILVDFCKTYNKNVAVILTEHLDFEDNKIIMHGKPLWSCSDYIPAATQASRVEHLVECTPYIRNFFTLGDLPILNNINIMMPGIPVTRLEFPIIEKVDTKRKNELKHDILFTGFITNFRKSIISLIKESELSIYTPEELVSKKVRSLLCESSKINLNIPQQKDWPWLSLMRIIAALRHGLPTISIATKDTSEIAKCCEQIDLNEDTFRTLSKYVKNWEETYDNCLNKYNMMAESYAKLNPFPHYFFEYWNLTDKKPTAAKATP